MPSGFLYDAGPAGDVNGDGFADFLFQTRYDPLTYMGGAVAISDGPAPPSASSQSFYAFGADYNGDGFADAASMTGDVSPIDITRGGPAGFDPSSPRPSRRPRPRRSVALATIDANGDGYADLAVATSDGVMLVLDGSAAGLGVPTPASQSPPLARPAGSSDTPVATGDFNGDGRPESARRRRGPSPAAASSLPRTSSTSGPRPASPRRAPRSRCPPMRRVRPDSISDVNGDGFEDVTVGLVDRSYQPNGSQTVHATAFLLFLGGPGGLKPAA